MKDINNIIEVNNVNKFINKNHIIDELSFSVKEGEIFGLLGPNGSGKTTTLRMLVGLTRPSSGNIKICGLDVHKNHKETLSQVGAIIENPEMYDYMTGYENLKQYARMSKQISDQDIFKVSKLVDIEYALSKKVKNYSLGMKQKLGIAQALLNSPKVLILDEPTNGLDPAGIKSLRYHLKKMVSEKNMSIIISSHLLDEIEKICDKVAIIKGGKLIAIEDLNKENNLTKVNYMLKIEPFEKAIKYLNINGYNFNMNKKTETIFIDSNNLLSPIPILIEELVSNNLRIHEVSKVKKSLEDMFMELTNKGD